VDKAFIYLKIVCYGIVGAASWNAMWIGMPSTSNFSRPSVFAEEALSVRSRWSGAQLIAPPRAKDDPLFQNTRIPQAALFSLRDIGRVLEKLGFRRTTLLESLVNRLESTAIFLDTFHGNRASFWQSVLEPGTAARQSVVRQAFLSGYSETEFFRHPEQFETLSKSLPSLVEKCLREGRPLRIVSAPSSAGLEALSAATIVILEREAHPEWAALRVEIVGFDIHPDVVLLAWRNLLSSQPFLTVKPQMVRGWEEEPAKSQVTRLAPYQESALSTLHALRPDMRRMVRFEELALTDVAALRLIAQSDVLFLNNVVHYLNPFAFELLREALALRRADSLLLMNPNMDSGLLGVDIRTYRPVGSVRYPFSWRKVSGPPRSDANHLFLRASC
jgi:chemotaxis methyl-accepting protein methylase